MPRGLGLVGLQSQTRSVLRGSEVFRNCSEGPPQEKIEILISCQVSELQLISFSYWLTLNSESTAFMDIVEDPASEVIDDLMGNFTAHF